MQGEGFAGDPLFSLQLGVVLLVIFASAAFMALEWRLSARQFPLTIALPTIAMLIALVIGEARQATLVARDVGGWRAALAASSRNALLPRIALFFGMLVAVLFVVLAIGQPVALTLYTIAYLLFWARFGIAVSLIYGALTLAFLVGFYGKLMGVSWLLPAIGWFDFLERVPRLFGRVRFALGEVCRLFVAPPLPFQHPVQPDRLVIVVKRHQLARHAAERPLGS